MVSIWVTRSCNMKCKYCYEGAEKNQHSMSIDVANLALKFIANEIKRTNDIAYPVVFHGGEPLLNFQIIKYIIDNLSELFPNRMSFRMTTNGLLLKDEMGAYLAEHMSALTVSLDGKQYTNDMNRVDKVGNSTFLTVLGNAKSFKELYSDLKIRMTVTSATCSFLAENIRYLLDEGFCLISAEVDFEDSGWNKEYLNILEEQCIEVKRELEKCDDAIVGLPIGRDVKCLAPCPGGQESFHIDTDGRIYPCLLAVGNDEFCIGDVVDGINGEKVKRLVGNMSGRIDVCVGCSGADSCINQRCKIINRIIMGGYDSPIPLFCELHRKNLLFDIHK